MVMFRWLLSGQKKNVYRPPIKSTKNVHRSHLPNMHNVSVSLLIDHIKRSKEL